MDLMTVLAVLGSATGVLALARLARGAWRVNRRVLRIADAVTELSPNSGHSIKDQVGDTKKVAERTEDKVDAVKARLDDHIRHHPGS